MTESATKKTRLNGFIALYLVFLTVGSLYP